MDFDCLAGGVVPRSTLVLYPTDNYVSVAAGSPLVRRIRIRRTFRLLIAVFLVTACTPTLVNFAPRVHIVQSGETLFSIAWRYQLDVRELILWNGLENPDLILVGQRLFLTPAELAGTRVANAGRTPAAPAASSVQADSAHAGTRQPESTQPPVSGSPAVPAGSGAESPATPAPRPQTAAPTASTPVPAPVSVPSPPPAPPAQQPSLAVLPSPTWQWPIRGPVVSSYGAAQGTGSGIGIGGQLGADIRASAAGQVVYAGDGLAAYGNLIIIKHNDTFLSAYGHNDELVVGEGDAVEQGEVIARMGMGPERQPQVHFEIRRNGTPVDPRGHLPN